MGGSPLRFKRLFGSEPNEDLLIHFLNRLIGEERQLVDLTYNKTEYSGHFLDSRKSVFDLLCTGPNGEQFIIEMQRVKQEYFKDRCLKEGIIEGIREGMKEGEKHGKLAGQKEIAMAMKKKGMETSLIQELTSLSVEEIEKL